MLFCTTRYVVGHEALENEWQVGLQLYIFEILRENNCMSVLSLHIESTDSIITSQFCSIFGGVLCSIRPAVHAHLHTESTVSVKEVKAVSGMSQMYITIKGEGLFNLLK